MTATFGTNAANDIYLGPDGNLVVLKNLPAIEAACATASKTQLGECVLQTGFGVPNFQTVWVGVPDYALWQSFLLTTLQNVEGVQQVTSLNLLPNNGTLNYKAEIQTQFGNGFVNA